MLVTRRSSVDILSQPIQDCNVSVYKPVIE